MKKIMLLVSALGFQFSPVVKAADVNIYNCVPVLDYKPGVQYKEINVVKPLTDDIYSALTNEVKLEVILKEVHGRNGILTSKTLKINEYDAIQASREDVRKLGYNAREVKAMYTSVNGNYRVLLRDDEIPQEDPTRMVYPSKVQIGRGLVMAYECEYTN